MKKTFLIMIIQWLFFAAQAQSLDDYIQIALENNPGLKSAYTEFEASMQQVAQSNALPDPTLSFGVFVRPVETRVGPQQAKISLTQMFPWFGTLKAREEVAALAAEAKYQRFLDQKGQLILEIKRAYYPIYELQEQIRWQEENLAILEIYKKLTTTSFSNGKGSLVDAIRVDILIDEAETNIQFLEDKNWPLRVQFNNLLNRPDSLEVLVSDDLQISAIEFVRDSLWQTAVLSQLDAQIAMSSAAVALAKKSGAPKLGVGLDYMIVGERSDVSMPDNGKDAIMPMVSLSLPIFRNKYKAAVAQSQLQQKSFEYQKEALMNRLTTEFEEAQYLLQRAQLEFALYEEQILKSQQAIDLLYSAYGNSGQDFEEVLQMQQRLLKYQMAKTTAIKNYYMAQAKLDYLTAKVD